MFDRRMRLAIAVLAPIILLTLAAWWGGNVRDMLRREASTFRIDWTVWAISLDYLLAGGGSLVAFFALRWSRSRILAVAYLLAGALLLFDPPLMWTYGASINGAPPVAPQPIATLLNEIYLRFDVGPGVAAQAIAAAMFVAGLVEFARGLPILGLSKPASADRPVMTALPPQP